MSDDLEERLNSHAKAFEGLMSLIPAKQYYGEDTSDQWQKKKQTKEQKRAAKKAKLDPTNRKSAKDILDENERKRKRELEDEDDYLESFGVEQPREGLKNPGKTNKKQKVDPSSSKDAKTTTTDSNEDERKQIKAQKRREKREQKKAQASKEQGKAQAKNAAKESTILLDIPNHKLDPQGQGMSNPLNQHDTIMNGEEISDLDVSGLVENGVEDQQSSSSTSSFNALDLSESAAPSPSSSSSIVPPADVSKKAQLLDNPEVEEKPSKPGKIPRFPNIDPEILRARLHEKIEALRAARKADGPDGRPARNRQELLDARRKKEEQRKTHKKELRKLAKEDEERAAAEAELARLRGSGSPLSTSGLFSPVNTELQTNFSFGRVAFDDGQQVDSTLSELFDPKRRKGPQDPRTALEAAKNKQARLSGLDVEKRKDIEEKNMWLNAKKRAHGERVRDDTNLLKKTLKRQEKTKMKSEREWNDRIEGVKKGQEIRQKKREENLQKRKEEKGTKGKSNKGKPKSKKPKGRPGFEGSFRG
ncbi:SURF6-domain-containing protein, partial [Patellaria atrata CBS 101060]